MQKLKILNRKNIKKIIELIKTQWDSDIELDYVFLRNEKGKIFIVNRDVEKVDLNKVRVNSVGMYFGLMNDNEIRLSIEGSQIVGPNAKKNVLELNDVEAKEWLRGEELLKSEEKGFMIIKHDDDFLGCGKSTGEKVLNFVSKARRVIVS